MGSRSGEKIENTTAILFAAVLPQSLKRLFLLSSFKRIENFERAAYQKKPVSTEAVCVKYLRTIHLYFVKRNRCFMHQTVIL